jgi:uncharacterized membrane protein YgcG
VRTGWRVAFTAVVVVAAFAGAFGIGLVVDATARDSAFRIDRFEQLIVVEPDGTPRVTELLTVTFTTERRGIFRDLDERTPFPSSGSYRDFAVDRGDPTAPWQWVEERHEHGPRLRIGNPSVYLSPGTYPYRITYTAPTWTVTRRDAPDLVELRVDVPGFDWPTTIGPTTLVIELPGEAVEAACVAGRERTTTPCEQAPQLEVRRVTLELGPFDVGESATVAVLVPSAAFTAVPPLFQPDPLDSNRGIGPWDLSSPVAALLLALLLAVPIGIWELAAARRHYRDRVTDPTIHDRAQPTALPAPPHGFRPPEVAGLLLRTDQQDLLLSTIVDLEQRGLLRTHVDTAGGGRWFSKATETLTLERPPAGTVFPPGDDELVRALVPEGGATVFSGTYDASVSTRVAATDRRLQQRAAKVFEAHGFEHDESGPFASGLFRFAAFLGFLLLAFVVASVFAAATTLPVPATAFIVGLVLLGWALAHIPWAHHRKPLNSRGRDAVGQARAFDHFVRTVEGEQLEWAAGQPGIDHHHPALSLLPYAIALGHADSWYDRFGPVLQALTSVAAGAGAAWWASSSSFSSVSSTQSATTTAPSSSGGGGGGGGGSGGGGGGGGSW